MRSPRLHLAHRHTARSQARSLYALSPTEQILLARKDFNAFRWYVKNHKSYTHHQEWSRYLNTDLNSRCLNGIAGDDLLILAPRGSSKSTFLIEWVAYQIGRHAAPEIRQALKVLYVSYELKTARQKSQQIKRLLTLPEYRRVFPWIRPGENWANELWEIDFAHAGLPGADEPYTVAAAGLIGNVTGKRCFVGDTLIETEIGAVPISEIQKYITLRILTFNESTHTLEWGRIKNVASRPSNELVEIRTSGGRRVRCTADHPIYTLERGYSEAQYLLAGDTLVVTTQGKEEIQKLPWMQQGNDQHFGAYLPRLLSGFQAGAFQDSLQGLFVDLPSQSKRTSKEGEKRGLRVLLQSQVSWRHPQEAKGLRELWNEALLYIQGKKREVLPGLPTKSTDSAHTTTSQVLELRSLVCPANQQDSALFSGLRQCDALKKDVWGRQQPLQRWTELRQGFSRLESGCLESGWLPLHCLRDYGNNRTQGQVGQAIEPSSPSLKPRPLRQSPSEFGDYVSSVPRHSSQNEKDWGLDRVVSVVKLPAVTQEVYDIEVEGNHNFFANQILSHNCHISVYDDLIKSPEAIANPDIREQMVSNYRNIIKPTRFDGARSICLGTRMRPDDIYCTEFTADNDWQVVEQSAILDLPDGGECSYWEPEDDESPGQTLAFLQSIREKEPETFSYQYQNKVIRIATQAITPELITKGIIPSQMDYLALGIDLSAGEREVNDYTAFVLGGMARDEKGRNRYFIIDCWEDRLMGNMKKLEAIAVLYDCWRHLCPYLELFVESNGYQLSFAGDYQDFVAEKEYYDWQVTAVHSAEKKLERLRGVTGLLENKLVTFNQYGRLMGKLTLQLTNHGSTSHDDLADAFEKCLRGLRVRSPLTGANY
jgi:phage terminase large subunit-like protein